MGFGARKFLGSSRKRDARREGKYPDPLNLQKAQLDIYLHGMPVEEARLGLSWRRNRADKQTDRWSIKGILDLTSKQVTVSQEKGILDLTSKQVTVSQE